MLLATKALAMNTKAAGRRVPNLRCGANPTRPSVLGVKELTQAMSKRRQE